jgi:hypothetical protein
MLQNVNLGKIKSQFEAWPHKNILVTCDVTDLKTKETFETRSLEIEEYNLVNYISELSKKYKICLEDSKKLSELIENLATRKYSAGEDDERMSNEDADI